GRSRPRAGSSSLGSAPRSVPSSSAGTRLAEACTQLFDPATLRPSDQGSLLAGPQNGAFTSEAACSRKISGADPPVAWWITLLCISTEPCPSCTSTAVAG